MEVHPSSRGDGNTLVSPTDRETSHLPVSQPSPEGRTPTFKPKAGGKCLSGPGFLKRKFPLWLKRKESANSPQGLVVSQSRLCVDVAHDSPIQAVRKPERPPKEALGSNSEEDLGRGRRGTSLLRRLLCLKATNSRLEEEEEASPPHRLKCGSVTSFSRTADPQGDSPLRWKPRAEAQSPAEPEKVETAHQAGASWLEKPWRNLRTMMTTGAKKASLLSGNKRNQGETGERVLETSRATCAKKPTRESQNSVAAVEDQTPSPGPPSEVDEHYGGREDEGTPQHSPEPHRRVQGVSKPAPKWPVREEENPILKVCELPGGTELEAGGTVEEVQGPQEEDVGCWLEVSAGEDLAELAENPGGQGMVMATRDLGWLNSEELGGPWIGRKGKGETVVSKSHTERLGAEEAGVVSAHRPGQSKCPHEPSSGAPLDKASRGRGIFPTSFAENAIKNIVVSPPPDTSALEGGGARCSVTLQETSPPFPSRELQQGAEGSPLPGPLQTLTLDPPGESNPSRGATPWPDTSEPDEQKRLIYMAAVEIVEAVIDAAAEQLAKKRPQVHAGPWGPADGTAAGPTTR